jgi:hypothetical protein
MKRELVMFVLVLLVGSGGPIDIEAQESALGTRTRLGELVLPPECARLRIDIRSVDRSLCTMGAFPAGGRPSRCGSRRRALRLWAGWASLLPGASR